MTAVHSPRFRASLERFCLGRSSAVDNREVVAHLLAGCPDCVERAGRIWPAASLDQADAEPLNDGYDRVFRRVERSVDARQAELAEERAEAALLMAELIRHPLDRQKLLIRNARPFRTWSLATCLLGECERARSDLAVAADRAEAALTVADVLASEVYGEQRVQDLRARTRIELAAVCRAQNRFRRAEALLDEAAAQLEGGTGDPLEKAHLCFYRASLWIDRRRFDEAVRLLERTVALASRLGEKGLWCKALLNRARCEIERGCPEQALAVSLQAQQLLDISCDPRLAVVLQHNVLYALVRCGRFDEAAAGLEDTRTLHEAFDHPIDRLRFDWVEGQVRAGLGQTAAAEELFRSSLEGFLHHGLEHDAAVLGLELAVLLSEQGRFEDLEEISSALLPVFRSARLGREVIASLLVFRRAVSRRRASADLVRKLFEKIRTPGLRSADRWLFRGES